MWVKRGSGSARGAANFSFRACRFVRSGMNGHLFLPALAERKNHRWRGTSSHPARDSGEGGPSCAAGWWKGRGPRRTSFDESDATSQSPPPPRCAWSPSPAIAGAEDTAPRSRGAIFCSPPSHAARHSQNDAAFRPSSDQSDCGEPDDHGRARRTNEQTNGKRKGSRTPKGATSPPHLQGAARASAGRARLPAFHCGSRQGDSWSPRLSVRPRFRRLGRGVWS